MSRCEDRIPTLVDLAEQTIEPAARAELEDHLASCATCRNEFETLCAGTSLLVNTRAEAHPLHLSGLAPRTAEAAERVRDGTWRGLWWSTTRGVRFALGASVASLALAIGLAITTVREPHVPASSDETSVATTASTDVDSETSLDDSLAYETGFDALSPEELDTLEQLLN